MKKNLYDEFENYQRDQQLEIMHSPIYNDGKNIESDHIYHQNDYQKMEETGEIVEEKIYDNKMSNLPEKEIDEKEENNDQKSRSYLDFLNNPTIRLSMDIAQYASHYEQYEKEDEDNHIKGYFK